VQMIDKILKDRRLMVIRVGPDGFNAYMRIKHSPDVMVVICSWGGGWDHVSASYKDHTPSWDEMCLLKDMMFRDDEWVVQYHPAKADYVNNHPYCLHLWRPQVANLPMPPRIFV
jgi:hypothetical protein